MLPTENETNIILDRGVLEYIDKAQIAKTINSIVEGFHLYFMSNCPIKKGDWYFFESERESFIRQAKVVDRTKEYWLDNDIKGGVTLKKIVATTNSSLLIEDGKDTIASASGFSLTHPIYNTLPQPSQEWIKYFINQYVNGYIITQAVVESFETIVGQCSCICHNSGVQVLHCMPCCYPEIIETIKVNNDNTIAIKSMVENKIINNG